LYQLVESIFAFFTVTCKPDVKILTLLTGFAAGNRMLLRFVLGWQFKRFFEKELWR